MKNVNKILKLMNTIEYGFKDKDGFNICISNPKKWDEEFYKFYYLQSPAELLCSKCGVCFDHVELERKLFCDVNIKTKTYFICNYDGEDLPSHTFLVFKDENNNFCWFENSWRKYRGVHRYKTIKKLLNDVKKKFMLSNNIDKNSNNTYVYEYKKPVYGISCMDFYNYMETQKLIRLNPPLYFYHLVDKNADLSKGLLSIQYMYDNKMYDLFDRYAYKYFDRITSKWNLKRYNNKKSLSRKEYIDALNEVRGKNGSQYIYFFRYMPDSTLGPRMKSILDKKDIYKININDEYVSKLIKDISYGYDMSHTDNKLLDREYYENITKKEYFSKYDDNLNLNFSTLNHISIAFKDGYCPIKYLKKV